MKIKDLIKSKLMLFCIQICVLISISIICNYKFQIDFDVSTDPRSGDQQLIIQFLANLIMYNDSFGFVYIYLTWIIVSLIPILILIDYKKAYSMNLTTFFFPNFFFYVFYRRYSETYFTALFPTFIFKSIILGITIAIISISLSLILKFVKNSASKANVENLEQIEQKNRTECPKCGTQFNSIPKYCFNCNNIIINDLGDSIEKTK